MSYEKMRQDFGFLSLLSKELGQRIVVVDTKTAGIGPTGPNQPIVDVAWLEVGEDYFERHSALINPEAPIHWAKTRLHGITDEMVAGAPTFKEFYPKLKQALDGAVISGFGSTRHDIGRFHAMCDKYELPHLDLSHRLDVRDMWHVMSRQDQGNLRDLCAMYNVDAGYLNRAMSDVMMAARVLNQMVLRHGTDFMYMQMHGKPRSQQQEKWMAVVDDELVREVLATSQQRDEMAQRMAQSQQSRIEEMQKSAAGTTEQKVFNERAFPIFDLSGKGYDFAKAVDGYKAQVAAQQAAPNAQAAPGAPMDNATMDEANMLAKAVAPQPDLSDWDLPEYSTPAPEAQSRGTRGRFAGAPAGGGVLRTNRPSTGGGYVPSEEDLTPGFQGGNTQRASSSPRQATQSYAAQGYAAQGYTQQNRFNNANNGNNGGSRGGDYQDRRTSRVHNAIAEYVKENGKIGPNDYASVAHSIGCKESTVNFAVSEMFNKGSLQRDEVVDVGQQQRIAQHLPDLLNSMGNNPRLKQLRDALQQRMGGQEVDYVQIHVALHEQQQQREMAQARQYMRQA